MMVNAEDDVALPAPVVITIDPVTALAGNVMASAVVDAAKKAAQGTPPTVTEITPLKPLPVTLTTLPANSADGEKPLIVGSATDALLSPPPPPPPHASTLSVLTIAKRRAVLLMNCRRSGKTVVLSSV